MYEESHWKDNLGIGIMDSTARADGRLSVRNTDLQAFDVIGYDPIPEPAGAALAGVAFLIALGARRLRPRPNVKPVSDIECGLGRHVIRWTLATRDVRKAGTECAH